MKKTHSYQKVMLIPLKVDNRCASLINEWINNAHSFKTFHDPII